MSIGISEEHVELAASLRKWAADLQGRDAARAVEHEADATFAEVWAAVEEMGIASIGASEALGGGGGSTLDVAVALEACAHELVPGPLLGHAVAVAVAGGALPAGAVVGLAPEGVGGLVWDAPSATHVLTPVDGAWQLVPRSSVLVSTTTGFDLTRRYGRLDRIEAGAGVPVDTTTERVRRTIVTLAAAEAAGVARWCLSTAVEYAKVREQFGQKIGSFQAVKHLCSEMLETSEAVTVSAWDAAVAADAGDEEQWEFAARVAAATAFDGAFEVAKTCIQVLGGIGFTFEHDAHLYFRRAGALRTLVGEADAAAEWLTGAAVAGVRRQVHVELDGRDEAVRAQVRELVGKVAAAAPADRRAALVETGLLAPHWPAPYGRGADPVEQIVIDEELARADVVRPDLAIAGWAVPTILDHGTHAQRERFVVPSLLAEIIWCQLFSEPGAGSDLAALRTKAVKVDGGWRLTGQKVWNSVAERADWGICLARTNPDAPKHRGITYFLVDMKNSPGIDVRPLREITGESLFNEVFLDDVFVPDDLVVGEVDDGWRLARTTLANERVAMGTSRLSQGTERAVELAADGATAAQRVHVGHAVAAATVCGLLGVRSTMRSLGGRGPGAESSVAKLLGVRNRQVSAELVATLLGDRLLLADDPSLDHDVRDLLNTRCLSIAGGTTQILRNIVGERILGLPR